MAGQAANVQGAEGAGADAVAAAHARLLQDRTLQFSFEAFQVPERPSWLDEVFKALEWLGPFLKWLFWAGLAATVIAILFFLGRELIRARWPRLARKPAPAAPAPEWRPEPARARALLGDADRLAAEGRFAEAAHLLLHRSIEDIEGRRPSLVRPALTSRDIASLDALPGAARAAFGAIAQVVEASFFGGRTVDAAAFERCRRAYEAFAFPEAWA